MTFDLFNKEYLDDSKSWNTIFTAAAIETESDKELFMAFAKELYANVIAGEAGADAWTLNQTECKTATATYITNVVDEALNQAKCRGDCC